ncbi:MAG: PspA/IM30 family protein [Sphingomonadales bacterium]
MGVLSKIITAIRGGATEVGEAIVDANSVRIFEQEIKDAENHLEKAKRDLTEVMAKEMQATRKIGDLTANVVKHEGYAAQALEKGDESLALEVAGKIAELQDELEIQQQAKQNFSAHVARLKKLIRATGKSLADMKRQLVMVKTTDSVQKATAAITDNFASSGSRLLSAKESLDRIQQRQRNTEDRLKAGEELRSDFEGGGLEERLQAAGIGETKSSADDILAKIKARKG